jgi:hypothetical protein
MYADIYYAFDRNTNLIPYVVYIFIWNIFNFYNKAIPILGKNRTKQVNLGSNKQKSRQHALKSRCPERARPEVLQPSPPHPV